MDSSGIYLITNTVDGKAYVGSAVNLSNRLMHHESHLRSGIHANVHLQRAWNKYGERSFDFSILEKCSAPVLLVQEKKWMLWFCATNRDLGYNFIADPISHIGYRHPPEVIAKMKLRRNSPDVIEKMRLAKIGKKRPPFSGEWRKNLRRSHIGKTGHPMSPELKKKLMALSTGRPMHPNTRAAIKKAKLGSRWSEVTKQKNKEKRINDKL